MLVYCTGRLGTPLRSCWEGVRLVAPRLPRPNALARDHFGPARIVQVSVRVIAGRRRFETEAPRSPLLGVYM